MATIDAKIIGGLMIAIAVVLFLIVFCLKKVSNKLNNNIERTSKLSMLSDKSHEGEEIDKRFILSTIYEEDYNNLNTNRISIEVIMETDGKISTNL